MIDPAVDRIDEVSLDDEFPLLGSMSPDASMKAGLLVVVGPRERVQFWLQFLAPVEIECRGPVLDMVLVFFMLPCYQFPREGGRCWYKDVARLE